MKQKLTSVLSILAACSLAMTLSACAPSAPAATGSESSVPASSEAAPASEKPTAAGEAEIAVVLKTLGNQYWQDVKAGVEAKAAELDIQVDIYAVNSEDDVEGQVSVMENCISKGYKAIAVAPLSTVNLNNTIAEATKQGIYVANIDERVDMEALKELGGAVCAVVATDNVAVGELAAGYIIEQLPDGGQIALIEGKAGSAGGEARKEGATKAFAANDKIELVDSLPGDFDRTKAYDIATNYISKYPELKAIYCINDTMALGAQQAVSDSGRDIMIVGTDGSDDAVASVQNGEMTATIAQDPQAIGARGVELLVQTIEEGAKIDVEAAPMEEKIDAKLIIKE